MNQPGTTVVFIVLPNHEVKKKKGLRLFDSGFNKPIDVCMKLSLCLFMKILVHLSGQNGCAAFSGAQSKHKPNLGPTKILFSLLMATMHFK